MNTLKNLKTIYYYALKDKKWQVALEAVELQAKYTGLLKNASPKPRYPDGRTELEMAGFIGSENNPHSPRNHPPPLCP